METKEVKTICDRCENYCVHPSGLTETCHAQRRVNSNVIAFMTDDYVNLRMNGEKMSCKEFCKLQTTY